MISRATRAAAVELLRCTADMRDVPSVFATGVLVGTAGPARLLAIDARFAVTEESWAPYADSCLEAAQRLEEGWEP